MSKGTSIMETSNMSKAKATKDKVSKPKETSKKAATAAKGTETKKKVSTKETAAATAAKETAPKKKTGAAKADKPVKKQSTKKTVPKEDDYKLGSKKAFFVGFENEQEKHDNTIQFIGLRNMDVENVKEAIEQLEEFFGIKTTPHMGLMLSPRMMDTCRECMNKLSVLKRVM